MIEFAVVIPTYRRSTFVAEAIESVLAQTLPAREVIVVCDGPGSKIPDHLRRGPVTIVEQDHAGVAVARNRGVAASTAEWVCFLDDDDLWHPEHLQRIADYLTNHPECEAATASSWTFAVEPGPGVDLVARTLAGCLEASTSVDTVTDMSYLDIHGRSFDLLLERNRGNISGATIRRELFDRAGGFPTDYTCAEEWLLFINVARYAEWHFVDERLSFVRMHRSNNTVANPTNGLMTVRAIHEAWSDRSRPEPPHRPLVDYGPLYRWTVQDAFWGSVRRRHFRIAADTLREGMGLLKRPKDRAYVLVPPQITWRIEHRGGLDRGHV